MRVFAWLPVNSDRPPGSAGSTSQPRERIASSRAAGSGGSAHGPRCTARGMAGLARPSNLTSMKASSLITRAAESKTCRCSGSLVASSSQNFAARLPSSRRASTTCAARSSAVSVPAYITT